MCFDHRQSVCCVPGPQTFASATPHSVDRPISQQQDVSIAPGSLISKRAPRMLHEPPAWAPSCRAPHRQRLHNNSSTAKWALAAEGRQASVLDTTSALCLLPRCAPAHTLRTRLSCYECRRGWQGGWCVHGPAMSVLSGAESSRCGPTLAGGQTTSCSPQLGPGDIPHHNRGGPGRQ